MATVMLVGLPLCGEVVAARDLVGTERSPVGQTDTALPRRAIAGEDHTPPRSDQPGKSAASTLYRDMPSVSGSYSIGGKTIMPYVGAGFGGGYASELDRHMGSAAPVPSEPRTGSQFAPGFSPNEFQMGVRIPF